MNYNALIVFAITLISPIVAALYILGVFISKYTASDVPTRVSITVPGELQPSEEEKKLMRELRLIHDPYSHVNEAICAEAGIANDKIKA